MFNDQASNVTTPLAIVWTQMDPIKDILLVRRMVILLGGLLVVIHNPKSFSSCVSGYILNTTNTSLIGDISSQVVFLMILTILGPQVLGTLRVVVSNLESCNGWKKVCTSIVMIVLSPFHMYYQQLQMSFIDLKLKMYPNDQNLIKEKEDLKRILNTQVKLELGLETVYQLSGQLILLLLAYTDTPTQSGLKTVFHSGLDEWSLFLLTLSILLSFKSCVTSHWKALTACREHFPFMAKLVSALFCFFACLTKVTAIITFFSGPLGLFNLLRHHQGEQYPWSTDVMDLLGMHGSIALGDSEPVTVSAIDRWKKNGTLFQEYDNGTAIVGESGYPIPNPHHLVSPPDYTLYVGMKLGDYLLAFFLLIGCHALCIFVAKCMLSQAFRNGFNFLEKIIHSLENTNIPYNSKEWDDAEGDAQEHRTRMRSNWHEVLVVIIINFVFNILHTSSLFYLGKTLFFVFYIVKKFITIGFQSSDTCIYTLFQ